MKMIDVFLRRATLPLLLAVSACAADRVTRPPISGGGLTPNEYVATLQRRSGARMVVRACPGRVDPNARPLIFVDGQRVETVDRLRMEDVAEIDVVKRATAVARFGASGRYGAILIAMKRHKAAQ
jgi:hypothetical protein